MLECVVNVSEGRDSLVIDALAAAAGGLLLDVHRDPHHNRSVLTLAGEDAALEDAVRRLTVEAMRRIDLRAHVGVHPRLGAVDVVPFVPLVHASMEDALAARNRYAGWVGEEQGIPCFLYGPERTLPHVRREAFRGLLPDTGPGRPHATAGAVCAGARPPLVAYNLWLAPGAPVELAPPAAREVRRPGRVRARGLDVGGRAQVSLNLIDPARFGPADAYDAVAARTPVARAELVGLVPAAVLDAIPTDRWPSLDLAPSRTIEARLAEPVGGTARPTPPPDGGSAPSPGEGAGAPAH
jgi:glutamate formiminotransferase